jgi:HK97 gp10 family phage protein
MPIVITGLSELSQMLTEESARTAKRYLVNCAKPAAGVVIEAMGQTVPVGLTGRLDDELTYQTRFSGDGDGTTLTVNIGPARSTWWGSFQEFGTFCQPAKHWMSRAWESCQDKCLSVFATEALARLSDMEERK